MNEFLTSASDSDGWSPQALYCRGNHLWHSQLTAGWVDHLADVDAVVKRTISVPARNQNLIPCTRLFLPISLQQPAPVRALRASDKSVKLLDLFMPMGGFLVIFIFTNAQRRAQTSKYSVDF
jgi:hypothetical protein